MAKIRIGISGYGNLGKGVELAIRQNDDMELAGIFTRRDPASVKPLTEGTGIHNGELRQSSFATYVLDPKAKTIDFNFSFFGKRYVFTANIMRLSRKEFFIEFDDEYGDHWRLELFSRSSY